jgi:dynein heavy chain 2, cytosolic
MIPCQRPIMLKNAMELAKLVKSETVSWNNEESVSHYVNILQKCVNKLNKDNTFLIGYHEDAKKIVIKLLNTSLTKRSQIWREEMKNLRDIVVTLEKKGYSNLDPFKLHWDYQLYKVLEHQYVMGLMDDEQRLPDINVDIVFR